MTNSQTEKGFPGGSVVKNLPGNAEDIREGSSIPGLGRSPESSPGNPLWYSWLENSMDRKAWWAIIIGSKWRKRGQRK